MSNPREQAAAWLIKLQEPEISAGELLRWEEWINRSKANRQAFAGVERFSRRVADYANDLKDIPVPSHPGRDRPETAAAGSVEMTGSAAGVMALNLLARWAARPLWVRRCALTAVAAVVIAAGAMLVRFVAIPPQADESIEAHQTAVAEHQSITLQDGSTIAMGARSSLSVNFSAEQRVVMLETGEALFQVAEDPGRPFIVMAGAGTITALGTVFNVRRDANRVVVTVTEGSVEVRRTTDRGHAGAPGAPSARQQTAARIGVGAQAVVSPTELSVVELNDPTEATQWQAGLLRYRAEPLQYVMEGVSRYSGKEIMILDAEIEEMLFTGSVFQDQTGDWLQALEDVFDLEVQLVDEKKVVIRKRLREAGH
ncbi:MAG: FecR domain-containing protein [Gammaproteobacteria bacterium]|nr:FecR domain-containing protein [Gammaproteobacteria bacterium]